MIMVIMVIEIVVAMRVIVAIIVRQMVIGFSFRLRGVGLSVCNNRGCAGIRLPRQRKIWQALKVTGVLAEKSKG